MCTGAGLVDETGHSRLSRLPNSQSNKSNFAQENKTLGGIEKSF